MYPKPWADEGVWVFWGVPLTVSMAPKLHVHISKERLFVFFDCDVEPEPPQRNSLHLPMSFSTVLYPTIYFFSCLYVVFGFFLGN